MSYQRLIVEHARIDAALARLRAQADAAEPDLAATAHALAAAATLLADHIAYEGDCLYSYLILSGDHPFSQTAGEFAESLSQLERDCIAYFRAWTGEPLETDWAEFRRQTCGIVTRLVERGLAENALLYTAALRESVIPLRCLAA